MILNESHESWLFRSDLKFFISHVDQKFDTFEVTEVNRYDLIFTRNYEITCFHIFKVFLFNH